MEYVRRSELPRYGRQTTEAKETSAEFAKLSYVDLPLSLSGRHFDLDNFLGREGNVEQVAFKGWIEEVFFLWESQYRNQLRDVFSSPQGRKGIASILVSQDSFSARDVAMLDQVTKKMKFDIVLSPNFAWDSTFKTLSSGKDLYPEFPISNPDRPVPTPRCCLSQLDPSLPDLSIPFQVPETLIGALSTIENHATPPGRRAFPAGHLEGTEHSPFCPRVDCAESG